MTKVAGGRAWSRQGTPGRPPEPPPFSRESGVATASVVYWADLASAHTQLLGALPGCPPQAPKGDTLRDTPAPRQQGSRQAQTKPQQESSEGHVPCPGSGLSPGRALSPRVSFTSSKPVAAQTSHPPGRSPSPRELTPTPLGHKAQGPDPRNFQNLLPSMLSEASPRLSLPERAHGSPRHSRGRALLPRHQRHHLLGASVTALGQQPGAWPLSPSLTTPVSTANSGLGVPTAPRTRPCTLDSATAGGSLPRWWPRQGTGQPPRLGRGAGRGSELDAGLRS